MVKCSLPLEFLQLQNRIQYVQEVISGHEWSSSCPQCGGVPHRNGVWPDRFRMFVSSKYTRKPLGWCRHCGYKWTPRQGDWRPTAEDIARLAANEEKAKKAHEYAVRSALERVRREKKWEKYHKQLVNGNAQGAYEWLSAGIPVEWWSYWQLGYDPDHCFYCPNGEELLEFHTPTLTIPIGNINGKITNIKHRLLYQDFLGARYRHEYRTFTEACFIANRKRDLRNKITYIAEGEKKAMKVFITSETFEFQVFGLPLSPSTDMLESIKGETIVYIGDPDATTSKQINRITKIFNDRNLILVSPPEKIDDYLNCQKHTAKWIYDLASLPSCTDNSKKGKVLWNLIV